MDAVGIRVHVEVNTVMRRVRLTGRIVSTTNIELISSSLIIFALNNVKTAERYGGELLPLNEPPVEKNNDFVYLEIMFKSMTDVETFLERIKNEPS